MTIRITVGELLDADLWMKYCALTGTNEWAVNEGLMLSSDTVDLTEEVARALFL